VAEREYEYSSDWFSHNIPYWDQLITQKQPRRIVEIGSYEGRSAVYLIEKCASRYPIELWCVDTWLGGVDNDPGVMGEVERRFDANLETARSRVVFEVAAHKLKSFSYAALAALLCELEPQSIDLVYIDGSHQAPDVLTDAVMAFPLLKVGGLMIFDDYLWSMERVVNRDPLNMPKPAIDAFTNIFMRKMMIIPGSPTTQIYAEKVAA
jgi:predicted O-methyltransferase YrrM